MPFVTFSFQIKQIKETLKKKKILALQTSPKCFANNNALLNYYIIYIYGVPNSCVNLSISTLLFAALYCFSVITKSFGFKLFEIRFYFKFISLFWTLLLCID